MHAGLHGANMRNFFPPSFVPVQDYTFHQQQGIQNQVWIACQGLFM